MLCNKGFEHTGEAITSICLEDGCRDDCLLCTQCIYEKHKTHNHMPIKIFKNQISAKFDNDEFDQQKEQENVQKQQLYDKILKEKSQTVLQIEASIQKLLSIKNEISALFDHYSETIELEFPSQDCIRNIVQSDSFQNPKDENFKDALKQLIPWYKEQQNKNEQKVIELKNTPLSIANNKINIFAQKLRQLAQTVNEQIQNSEKFLQTFRNIRSLTQFKDQKFQELHKDLFVYTQEQSKIKKILSNSQYNLSLLTNGYQEGIPLSIKYRIINANSWVAVGAFIMNSTSTTLPKTWDINSNNHKGYFASSNGYMWSTSESSQNRLNKNFNFTSGQTITVDWDGKSILKFHNESNKKTELLSVKLPTTKDEQLFPACILYYQNQEIELILDTI